MNKRNSYSAKFKSQAAMAAIKEEKTLNEIAETLGVHPQQITKWKKQAVEGLPEVFADKRARREQDAEALQERLYQEIGRLKVELDWLKKKHGIEPGRP